MFRVHKFFDLVFFRVVVIRIIFTADALDFACTFVTYSAKLAPPPKNFAQLRHCVTCSDWSSEWVGAIDSWEFIELI